ncbi:adenosine receptor A3-like [Oculina patagonica]
MNTSAINTSSKNSTGSSMNAPSKAEGIAWCSTFILTAIFIVVGNLFTIILFAVNKKLRKKSLFLVINMAFADLMIGALSLPIYIYDTGSYYNLWTGGLSRHISSYFFGIVHAIFMNASLISAAFISGERLYAVYWPFKHRTLSMRTYRIVLIVAWTLVFTATAVSNGLYWLVSYNYALYEWMTFFLALTFIMSVCNIAIWRKFRHESVPSQQQNRASQNKRLTKTLLVVSILALFSWLPYSIMYFLVFVCYIQISDSFYYLITCFTYSNSFINPVVYALRIPEFRQALASCCFRRQVATNMDGTECRDNTAAGLATKARILRTAPSHLQLEYEQEVMDTKL